MRKSTNIGPKIKQNQSKIEPGGPAADERGDRLQDADTSAAVAPAGGPTADADPEGGGPVQHADASAAAPTGGPAADADPDGGVVCKTQMLGPKRLLVPGVLGSLLRSRGQSRAPVCRRVASRLVEKRTEKLTKLGLENY